MIKAALILFITYLIVSSCCVFAAAANVRMLDGSLSVDETIDGRTFSIGYEINSDVDTSAQLTASLIGPNGKIIEDSGNNLTLDITSGTNWYYRDFFVNMPPGAQVGLYDVVWTVRADDIEPVSITKQDCLEILPPVPVRVPILTYHNVGTAPLNKYWVFTDELERQMAALKAYGYTTISLSELMSYRCGLAIPPPKPVILTFDDRAQNFYTDAFPILSKLGLKSTAFVMSGSGGLTWDEMAELKSTGLVEFESHTVTHPILIDIESTPALQDELSISKQTIEDKLGTKVEFIAYPGGYHDLVVEQACRDAGYFAALSVWEGVEPDCRNKWTLRRIGVYTDASVNYDPARPDLFFFNKLGDLDLKLPLISISSIEYLDPVSGNPIPDSNLRPGQSVKIQVTAVNSGPPAEVTASLVLDSDSDPANGNAYDSHVLNPSEDIIVNFATGQQVFSWLWTVPDEATKNQYYAAVSFHDKYYLLGFRLFGYQPAFTVDFDRVQLEAVKTLPDNTPVLVRGTITAAFADYFYIESRFRTLGIRVVKTAHGLSPDTEVDVAGYVADTPQGERCIVASNVIPKGTGHIAPVWLNNSAVGGGTFGYQDGVWEYKRLPHSQDYDWLPCYGLNNTGLLIRISGHVKSINWSGKSLVLDDGSALGLKCICDNLLIVKPDSHFITITGISSCERVDEHLGKLVLITSIDN